jgi:predicted transcriptional regulator
MSIIKAHVDDESKTVLKMVKSSIMDYVKKMPGAQLVSLAKNQNQRQQLAQP